VSSAFQVAVLATDCLAGAYRSGLQVVRKQDRQRITCQDGRRLTGSIDVDQALHRSHPDDNRWDYGIGVKHNSEHVVWIEIHPASSSHVQEVIAKLTWLRGVAEIGSALTALIEPALCMGRQWQGGPRTE
jgi:hypothetical protein